MSALETLLAAAQFVEMQDSLKSQFQPQLYSSNNNNSIITTNNNNNNTQLLPINGLLLSSPNDIPLSTTSKSSPTSLSPYVITNPTNTIPKILEPSTIIASTVGGIPTAVTTTKLATTTMKLTPSKLNIPHLNGTRYQSLQFQPQNQPTQPKQQQQQHEISIKTNSNADDDKIHRRRYKSNSEYVISRKEEFHNSTNATQQNRQNHELIAPPVLSLLSTSSPTPASLPLQNNSLSPTFETSRSRSSSFSAPSISAINNNNLIQQHKQQHLRHLNVPTEETTQHSLYLSVSSKSGDYISGGNPNVISSGNSGTGTGSGHHFNQNNSLSISPINNTSANTNDNLNINAINMNSININAIQQQHNNNQIQPPSRRRTVSTNSNGAGTREVHNKLEKNRRAHLKECFEALKKQLPQMNEEKKTSNLSILGNACRHILSLKRREREMEHEMERLAKEKISKQQQILNLRRELSIWDQSYMSEFEIPTRERFLSETVSEPLMPLTSRIRYASTSSLSSGSPSIAVPPTVDIFTTNHQTIRTVSKSPQFNAILNTSLPISLITKKVDSNFYQNSSSLSSSSSASASSPPPLSSSPLSSSSSPSPSIIASTTMPITSPSSVTSSSSTGHVVATVPVSSSIKITPMPNGIIQHPQQIAINFTTTTNDVNFTPNSVSSLLSSLSSASSKAPSLSPLNHVSTNPVQMPLNLNINQQSIGKNIIQIINTTNNNNNNNLYTPTTTATTTVTLTSPQQKQQQKKMFTFGSNANSSMPISSSSSSSSPFTISNSTLIAKDLNSNLVGKNGYHHQHAHTSNNEYNNINFNQKLLQLQNNSKNTSNSVNSNQNTSSHSITPINNVTDILMKKESIKYSDFLPLLSSSSSLSMPPTTTTTMSSSSSSSVGAIVEPPTKVIKLINCNNALTSVDNTDNHYVPTEQLTLPQVVVSPIPLIGQSQSLRVIGQTTNGLATIELTNSNGNVQRNNNQHQHQNIQPIPATGAQLHKLLLSGSVGNNNNNNISNNNNNKNNNTNSNSLLRNKQNSIKTAELTRLPGGAELNSLPCAGIKGLYRGNNGISVKGTIDTIGDRTPVHMVATMPSNQTPITILSHGRLLTSSSQSLSSLSQQQQHQQQLSAKVVTSIGQHNSILPTTTIIGPQYLNTTVVGKPLMLTVAASGGFTGGPSKNNNNLLNAKTTTCGISLPNEITSSSSNVLLSLSSPSSSSSSSPLFSATTTTTLSSNVVLSPSTISLPIATTTTIIN